MHVNYWSYFPFLNDGTMLLPWETRWRMNFSFNFLLLITFVSLEFSTHKLDIFQKLLLFPKNAATCVYHTGAR